MNTQQIGATLIKWEGTAPSKGFATAYEANEYNAQRTIAMKLGVDQWKVRVWLARGEALVSSGVC